jgi:hypothetical protein
MDLRITDYNKILNNAYHNAIYTLKAPFQVLTKETSTGKKYPVLVDANGDPFSIGTPPLIAKEPDLVVNYDMKWPLLQCYFTPIVNTCALETQLQRDWWTELRRLQRRICEQILVHTDVPLLKTWDTEQLFTNAHGTVEQTPLTLRATLRPRKEYAVRLDIIREATGTVLNDKDKHTPFVKNGDRVAAELKPYFSFVNSSNLGVKFKLAELYILPDSRKRKRCF